MSNKELPAPPNPHRQSLSSLDTARVEKIAQLIREHRDRNTNSSGVALIPSRSFTSTARTSLMGVPGELKMDPETIKAKLSLFTKGPPLLTVDTGANLNDELQALIRPLPIEKSAHGYKTGLDSSFDASALGLGQDGSLDRSALGLGQDGQLLDRSGQHGSLDASALGLGQDGQLLDRSGQHGSLLDESGSGLGQEDKLNVKDPLALGKALYQGRAAAKDKVCAIIGKDGDFYHQVLIHYMNEFDFSQKSLDQAFRSLC